MRLAFEHRWGSSCAPIMSKGWALKLTLEFPFECSSAVLSLAASSPAACSVSSGVNSLVYYSLVLKLGTG